MQSNAYLQLFNNLVINTITGTVQIWHAMKHLYPNDYPSSVSCFSWPWSFALLPGALIAVQYKANRIDKQKMQLNGLVKNVKSLLRNKQYGLLLLASLVTLGTIVAFAMQSFFVLKTIVTDFWNFFFNFIYPKWVIINPKTAYGVNLTSAVISIAAGIFQSLCTSAMIFKLFKWNEEIKAYMVPFWQRNKGLVFAGILNNLVYSGVNALMTVVCVQDSLSTKQNSTTGGLVHNQTMLTTNISSILNCSLQTVDSNEASHSFSYEWWVTTVAILVAVAQAIPMFFNNLLYNFFVNIPKAEAQEVERINEHLPHGSEQITLESYRIRRRGTTARLTACNASIPGVAVLRSRDKYVDFKRTDIQYWLNTQTNDCNP